MRAEILPAGDTTLPRLLRFWAEQKGEGLALREKEHGIWKRYSWNHYYRTAREVGLGLLSLGIEPGDRIAIASEDTPEWYYTDLGAQMIGAIVVGIYPTNPWPELQYIVRHSGARIVVTGDQEQTDKVFDAMNNEGGLPAVEVVACVDMKGLRHYSSSKLMSFEALCERGKEFAASNPHAESRLNELIETATADDVCILVYTSGTTGKPKGAMLSHRNLIYSVYGYAEAIGMVGKSYEAMCYLPLCHVAERCYSTVMQLTLGGVVNFAESIDTVALNIREIAPTYFIAVPRIWEKLQQNFMLKLKDSGVLRQRFTRFGLALGRRLSERREAANGRLSVAERLQFEFLYWALFRNIQRYLGLNRTFHRLSGGASISPETLRFFDSLGLPISQGYGLTETSGCAFIQSAAYNRIGGCGKALRDTEWEFAVDDEILIRGPGLFKGYFLDKKATDASYNSQGWLLTGDIGGVLDNGELTIVDRKKAIIITSGGKNIAPSEIENALKDHEFVKEAIVVGDGRKFIGALIQIYYETVGRWASEKCLAYTNYKSLSQLPEVYELIGAVVRTTNERFARVEGVRRFVILDKELDHDDGELTATQKVRRAIIDSRFERELEQIYGAA
ncbi:AMP-dependent synthetase/ligase [Pseudorhodoplanes sp.]|uniref:AMP-dependent synthetase/ligase n=1 Tax=Pseudorhodoplanes sp. TaxID=1934341 RepID=UPI003D0E850F